MVETLLSLVSTFNSLTPLAIIGLLAVIIYFLVSQHRQITETAQTTTAKVAQIRDNDMHELMDTLRAMSETLRRIEQRQIEAIATVVGLLTRG